MKRNRTLSCAAVLLIVMAGLFRAHSQPSNAVTPLPVPPPVPSRANAPLREGILAWDGLTKSADITNGQNVAKFVFSFTNAAADAVTILAVLPSCGCTTAELPPVPWTLPAGTNGAIRISVNLQGKTGTLFKSVAISTDQGRTNLRLRVNVLPPDIPQIAQSARRTHDIAAALADRQAVFKGDCAGCHLKNFGGQFGQPLFSSACGICHEASPRASMVPDLHNLKNPTSEAFWRAWITAGKAGTLMPAFAASQGGPLNDLQIASLAVYLNVLIPSCPPAPPDR